MKKEEWRKFHGFTEEEVKKFDVFFPPGKIISIEDIKKHPIPTLLTAMMSDEDKKKLK